MRKNIIGILKDYENYLPLISIIKLKILQYHYEKIDITPTQIQSKLKKELEKISKKYNDDEITGIFEKYFDTTRNIKYLTDTYENLQYKYELLQVIGVSKFVETVLKKYPYPLCTGFPFEHWTGRRMRKYIRLYFDFPSKRKKDGIPTVNSIDTTLREVRKNKRNLCQPYSFKNLINHYYPNFEFIQNEKQNNLYYLLMTTKKHDVCEQDKKKKGLDRKPNRTFFCTCIYFYHDGIYYDNQSYARSYHNNKKNGKLNFHFFLNKFSKFYSDNLSNTIFVIIRNGHKRDLKEYYNTLKTIPNFQLILIDTAKGKKNLNIFNRINEFSMKTLPKTQQVKSNIQQRLSNDSNATLSKTLKTIENIIGEVTKLKMKDKTDTPKILEEITQIIDRNKNAQKP